MQSVKIQPEVESLHVAGVVSKRNADFESGLMMLSSNLIRHLYESIDDAVIVYDQYGRILEANRSACQRLGYSLDEMRALCLSDIEVEFRALFRPDEPPRCERGTHRSKTGKHFSVEIKTSRFQENGNSTFLCIYRDISERTRLERHLGAQAEIARIIAIDQDTASSARTMLQIICEAYDFDIGVLWQQQSESNHLYSLGVWSTPNVKATQFIVHSQSCMDDAAMDLARKALRDGQASCSAISDASGAMSSRYRAAREIDMQQVFVCPILSDSETTGMLELWTRRDAIDEQISVTALMPIANQIGQFLNRKRVEKELRDAQALHVSLVRLLPQNIFRKDRQGRFTFGNDGYCASLKLTLPELLGKTDFHLFPADIARKYVADDQRIMQSGQPLDTIETHILPDGKRLFVHVVKTPVYDADYEVVGVQGIFWDVTHEVLAHEAVANSEKRYRQLAEAALDGIVVIDDQGRVVLFNPAAERMFGELASEIVGKSAAALLPTDFRRFLEHGVRTRWKTRLRRALSQPQEFNAIHKDGTEFPVEVALSLLADPDEIDPRHRSPMHVLAAIRDLSERNKMRSVLVQNEKLASIGLLSAGVAHEINNPLAFVANNLVVLQRDCAGLLNLVALYEKSLDRLKETDAELATEIQTLSDEIDLEYVKGNLHRVLARTRDGIDRVSRIVQSLRGMARTDKPRRQNARLPELINSSLEIIHGKFKHLGITVEQTHDTNPVVSCVAVQISQVILNLLVNAFQAIASARRTGGNVAIETKRLNSELLLRISDNGPGIPSGNLGRLFDPFFTTKDVGEGTGLGLSISHHIITAHGGRIEVDSKVGEGTTFLIYLPLTERVHRSGLTVPANAST